MVASIARDARRMLYEWQWALHVEAGSRTDLAGLGWRSLLSWPRRASAWPVRARTEDRLCPMRRWPTARATKKLPRRSLTGLRRRGPTRAATATPRDVQRRRAVRRAVSD